MILILLKSLSSNTQTQLIIASMVKVDNVDYDVVSVQEVININWPWTNMWTHFIWLIWINCQNEVICNSFWIIFTIHKKSYIQSIISDSSCLNNSFDWNTEHGLGHEAKPLSTQFFQDSFCLRTMIWETVWPGLKLLLIWQRLSHYGLASNSETGC